MTFKSITPGVGKASPWGAIETVDVIDSDNGLVFVSTASHGGIFVPSENLERIPAGHRAYAKRWSGSVHWYEEDVAWALVALAFPESFSAGERTAAHDAVRAMAPELLTDSEVSQ